MGKPPVPAGWLLPGAKGPLPFSDSAFLVLLRAFGICVHFGYTSNIPLITSDGQATDDREAASGLRSE